MKTTDFHKVIKGLKIFGITVISLLFTSTLVFAFLYINEVKSQGDSIYVISDSGTFIAKKDNAGERHSFDLRNHTRLFFQNMFSHDEYSFVDRIETALHLIEKEGGKRIYNDMKKGGVYDTYKKYNARTNISFDSIHVDMNSRPYHVTCYAIQTVYYDNINKSLPIAAVFEVSEVSRSEKNPFGLLINNFEYIAYDPDKSEE